ncbi:MAG: flavin reductase [Alphaproteobacteria bacterium]|nr:flavin reductase [Alphaproteobacteria bacterium]
MSHVQDGLVTLATDHPIWDRFFTVFPLVLIGTREADGSYDLAPKHMAMPMSWDNFFGFVCTPKHGTYKNIEREQVFTVSYPRPTQVVLTSIAAGPRCGDGSKPNLMALHTIPAREVDGEFVRDGSLFLECRLHKIIDGFSGNSLITGRVVAAHVPEDALRESERDDSELFHDSPLLAYLHPGRFATIRESLAFPFPAGFKR